MSVFSAVNGSPASTSSAVANSAKTHEKAPAKHDAKAQLNASIVTASLEVSIKSQNEPLALLYKSAINSLNEALYAEFGENAIQNAASQDNTPEGTAGRIVSLSTAFFEAYKQQHPSEDEAESLKTFMHTIKEGMERGFREAREILQGLGVLGGDIAANIDKTYELVQKGYADFEAAQMARISAPAEEA